MNNLHAVWQYFTTLPASSWYGLAALLVTSGVVSGLVQTLKPVFKKLESKYGVEAKKLIVGALGLLSFAIATAGDYVTSNGASLGNVGNHAAWIMAIAVALYHFGGSKTYTKCTGVLSDIQTVISTGQLPGGKPKS
jgi:hypothetical protein